MFVKYTRYTFVLYFLAILLLFFLVDQKKAKFSHLNILLVNAEYPLSLNGTGDKIDVAKLYYSLTYYKILADIHPELSQADEMAGYCYYFLKNYKNSQRWLEKAFKIHPERVWVTYNLGMVAYKQGDLVRSMHYFESIANGDPQSQMSGAVLSDLSSFPLDKRKLLYILIPSFINDIREKSMVEIAQNDGLLMLHPWWHFFSPGQEVLY